MRRSIYAFLLLALLVLTVMASQAYVSHVLANLSAQIDVAYQLAASGDYPAAKSAYQQCAADCNKATPQLLLFVRRSMLDKMNETAATLHGYANQDNLQDLTVETERVQKQISQLRQSLFAAF